MKISMFKTGYIMKDLNKLIEEADSLKQDIKGLSDLKSEGFKSDGSCSGELISKLTSLQDIYKQLLFTNLEFALDKKIDHDLWNVVFKSRITTMQQKSKDKNNTRRDDVQTQLTMFLDAASGFYSTLLHELCQTFNVDIPGRVKSNKLSRLRDNVTNENRLISQPKRRSCQYMCQHSLVHLGDIARYRNQNFQAESYYLHAAQFLPSSGHPYNQLAILASANFDMLKAAFYYCRSIAVKGNFPGSGTNLQRQLSRIIRGDDPKQLKISTNELLKFFLKFHACIYLKEKESELSGIVEKLYAYIRAHLRAGSLSHQQITHMIFINLFSLRHLSPHGIIDGVPVNVPKPNKAGGLLPGSPPHAKVDVELVHRLWKVVINFSMSCLGELLTCVPIHGEDSSELEHVALPSIKLFLDWLTEHSSVLKLSDITSYSRVWPRLARLLNALGNQDMIHDMNGYPLPEDVEVRGFEGLIASLQKLNFKAYSENYNNKLNSANEKFHNCRCYRLFQLGLTINKHNSELLSTKQDGDIVVFSSNVPLNHNHKLNGITDNRPPHQQDHDETSSELLISSDSKHQESPQNLHGVSNYNLRQARKNLLTTSTSLEDNSWKNRVLRVPNPTNQNKPESKLKVIKEEDNILRSCSHEEDFGSECGVASNTDSLSQGDLNSSPNFNTPTTTRSNNRVTFATMLPTTQRFSPSPYPTEQSPSPSSTTSGSANTDAPKSYSDLSNSPQQQTQMLPNSFRPIIRPIFRENFPTNQTSQPIFAANHLHITPYAVPRHNHFSFLPQPTTTRFHQLPNHSFHCSEPNKPRMMSNILINPEVSPSSFGVKKDQALMEQQKMQQQMHQNYFQKTSSEIKSDPNHIGVFNIQPWLSMNPPSNSNNLASSQLGTNQSGFQQSTNRPTLVPNNSKQNIFMKTQHPDKLSQSPVPHHQQTSIIGNMVNGVNNFNEINLPQSNHGFTSNDNCIVSNRDNFNQLSNGGHYFSSLSNRQPPEYSEKHLNRSSEESYKLFPDNDTTWGLTRTDRMANEANSSSVGTIGSERAAAHHHPSPWNLQNTSTINKHIFKCPSVADNQSKLADLMMNPHYNHTVESSSSSTTSSNIFIFQSQSFFSSPMTLSTSSALEKLIYEQQLQNDLSKSDPIPP